MGTREPTPFSHYMVRRPGPYHAPPVPFDIHEPCSCCGAQAGEPCHPGCVDADAGDHVIPDDPDDPDGAIAAGEHGPGCECPGCDDRR